jgi:hypothetical protein
LLIASGAASGRSRLSAWRIRSASAGGALLTVLVLRSALPAHAAELGAYLCVTTFGYGHLLGASFAVRRRRGSDDAAVKLLRAALVATFLASVYAAFTGVLAAAPWIVVPMLYASVWHIVENDIAIGRSHPLGLSALPFPRSLDHQLLAAALSGLVAVLAARSPGAPGFEGIPRSAEVATWCLVFAPGPLLFASNPGSRSGRIALASSVGTGLLVWHGTPPWLRFWEVFAGVTCYHLIEWLLVVDDKARARSLAGLVGERRRVARRTLLLHLPAVVVCVAAFAGGESTTWLRGAFHPAGYLLFSLLHVAHTAAIRVGSEPLRLSARGAA